MKRFAFVIASTTTLALSSCGGTTTSNVSSVPDDIALNVSCTQVVDHLAPLQETEVSAKALSAQQVAFRINNYPTACAEKFSARMSFVDQTMALQIGGQYQERCLCTVGFDPFPVSLPSGVSWQDFQDFQFRLIRADDNFTQASWTVRDLQGF